MTHPFVFLGWLEQQLHLNLGNHVTHTWLVMALLILVAVLVKRNIETVPTGLQNFFEPAVAGIEGMIEETMGPKGKAYFPLIATLAFFILVSNLIALIPGFYPPTANLNTNAAMALTVFAVAKGAILLIIGASGCRLLFTQGWKIKTQCRY